MKKAIIVVALIVVAMGYYKYKQNKKAKSVASANVANDTVDTTEVIETPEIEKNAAEEVADKVQLIVDAAIEETAEKFEELENKAE